jgi:hypothetical protein
MQSNGHHLRRLLPLTVERVEIVAQRDEEILGLTPAQATREARVVVVVPRQWRVTAATSSITGGASSHGIAAPQNWHAYLPGATHTTMLSTA